MKLNETILWSYDGIFTKKANRGVISSWSAASYWGFSPLIDLKVYITYPKGYNPNIKSPNVIKKHRSGEMYSSDIKHITFDNIDMNVYSPERTIVEIIKDAKGNFNDVLIETIRTFFSVISYKYSLILKWAKKFNIEGIVKAFFAMNNE